MCSLCLLFVLVEPEANHLFSYNSGLRELREAVLLEEDLSLIQYERKKEHLLSYADSIMCASYDISNMVCCECDDSSTLINFINDQHLRDMRHRTLCIDLKGEIGECSTCKKMYHIQYHSN